jgi:hypothetical protein
MTVFWSLAALVAAAIAACAIYRWFRECAHCMADMAEFHHPDTGDTDENV